MRTTGWIRTCLCGGQLLFGGATIATERTARAGETQPPSARSDGDFVRRALGVNELELQLARLTAGHASSYEVKEMGEKMLQKHTEIGHQLARLARQAGVSEKAELSPEQRATAARIASLSGSDFDSAFKATVDAGHVSELAMYREESTRAASPELRALAERRVTALEQSLAKAGPEQKVSRKKEW